MSVTRQMVIAALLGLLSASVSWALEPPATQPSTTPAAVIRFSGEVNDYSRNMLFHRFRDARAAGAKTIIVAIDTYGGMVTSALDISRFIRGQSDVHTIAYIDNKAISAGALVAMACDEIVMAPAATIGDCAPIQYDDAGHLLTVPPTERAKFNSPIISDFDESSAKNHYEPLIGRAMVDVQLSVYLVQNATGQKRVVDADEFKRLTEHGVWLSAPGVQSPVDGPETLLTVGADTAQKLGLSKATVTNVAELAQGRALMVVADFTPGVGDDVVEALNGGISRFFLIVVFLISLYIVLHAPGHGAAEAVGIISLGLLVGVPLLTGYAQWWEIALIVGGLMLCAFELLVFPGHGVSLLLGLVMVFTGLIFTFAGRGIGPEWLPAGTILWPRLKHGMWLTVGASAAAMVGMAILRPFLPKLPLFRKLMLTESSPQPVSASGSALKAGDDVWPFVGTVGVAVTDLRPGGVVRFPYGADCRNADVYCFSGFVPAGAKVHVQEARGNRIVVKASPGE